jgi:multidrug efflux pump subunit AcrB
MRRFHALLKDRLGFEDLSYRAIQRWRLLLAGCVGLLLLAWMAWTKIPRLEDPKVDPFEVGVTLVYPGASPEDVEAQVVKVVEEELYGMEAVEWVESTAYPNAAFFHVKFEDGTNMDVAAEKIRGKVAGRKKDLPTEVKDAEVVKYSTGLTPQMIVAIAGNRSDGVLTDAAKRLKDILATVPGVAGIDLRGERKQAIRVRLDPVRLAQHRLGADQVVERLRAANVRIPGGELKVGPLLTLLQVNQEFTGAEAVRAVPVGASSDGRGSGQVVTLGDVADVRDEALTPKQRFVVNGLPAVGMALRFRSGENAVKVGDEVRAKIQEVQHTFPEGTTVEIVHDQPKWIARSISNFIESLAEGIALVMLIITLGMGWRAALVVSGVLPLAAGGAVFGLFALGFSLEQVSIAGLIVALGLLVDDAVVVTESIQIMRDKGISPLRAAVFGTARVFWANNGTTAVACAAFVPLFFMGGSTGLFIKGLPTAVLLALVFSLLVAQLFTPWASTFFLKPSRPVEGVSDEAPFDRTQDSGSAHEESNPVLRWLKGIYARHIGWVVAHPLRVLVAAVVLFAGALLTLPRIGFQFFPQAEKPALFISLELPKGAHEELTAEKTREVLGLVRQDPDVEVTSATVGSGYPAIFGSRIYHRESKDYADIFLRLREGSRSAEVAQRLRGRLTGITGVNLAVEELWYGPPLAHPIVIRVIGDDYAKLRAYAEEVKAQIKTHPGAINVKDSLTENIPLAKVQVDSGVAMRVGLTPGQVGGTLRWLYGEDKITEFRRGNEQVQVVLDPVPSPTDPIGAVEETPIPNALGNTVPLRQVGAISLDRGFAELKRRNTRRVVEITADVDAHTLPADVVAKVRPWLDAKQWEPGYRWSFAGAQEETEKSFRNLGLAAVGAILLIFLLLVLMFDSLTLATVVMLAVPFALIGAVFGLAVTGNPFGFMSFLGLIALIGVYVNHKIYFVERMQALLGRGMTLADAILHAGQDRLRPVVLTALTAILGLLPLTLSNGKLWAGFGWVNIFGLLASIPLSLILLPALIVLAYRLERRGLDARDSEA